MADGEYERGDCVKRAECGVGGQQMSEDDGGEDGWLLAEEQRHFSVGKIPIRFEVQLASMTRPPQPLNLPSTPTLHSITRVFVSQHAFFIVLFNSVRTLAVHFSQDFRAGTGHSTTGCAGERGDHENRDRYVTVHVSCTASNWILNFSRALQMVSELFPTARWL